MVHQVQFDPQCCAERPAPASEFLRGLAVDAVEREKLRPAVRIGGCGHGFSKCVERRKAAVTENQHRQRRTRRAV